MKGQEAIFFSFEIEFRFLSESKDSNISAPGVEALEGRKSLLCDLLLSLNITVQGGGLGLWATT